MFRRVWFILKYWLSWILFFEVARLIFLISNFHESKLAGASFLSLWYGLRMDMSMASYVILPIALILMCSVFINPLRSIAFYKIYTRIILFILLLFLYADIGLYKAWGFRLDATFLRYLSSPKEVWASLSHLPIVALLFSFVLLFIIILFGSNKLLNYLSPALQSGNNNLLSFFIVLIFTGFFIIPVRGGFQLAPLNQSSVYFSKNNFANMAAINATWNFFHTLSRHSDNNHNPFIIDNIDKANAITDSLFIQKDRAEKIIDLKKNPSPNVIFIVWESLTSKAVGLQIQGKTITPRFNELLKEGIYFSNIYATGDRTDNGIVGVLSGYPSQPTTSIIKQPAKAAKLPVISKVLKQKGYQTSFYYGGELEFANMKAYLMQSEFDQFITIDDFDRKNKNSKWGAHDGVVMERLKDDINKFPQPFFSTWLTLSSHEPYEIPSRPLLAGTNDVAQFLSSIHYTDSIVYDFIQYSKKQTWWDNTLIIIVADHGHSLPRSDHKFENFTIPLLFLGGALNQQKTVTKVSSQTDIAATVLSQLNITSNDFKWSKNILDSSSGAWAFYSFNNGFGYIQADKKLVFDNIGNIPIEKFGDITTQDIYVGKVFQQAAYQNYIDK